MTDKRAIRVVAAALYDEQGRVLIADRPAGKHMAGRWEFPGGKVGNDETLPDALSRELHEELGIKVDAARPLMNLTHDYPDRRVELHMWLVDGYAGVPAALMLTATHPRRIVALALLNGWVRLSQCDDFPIGLPADMLDAVSDYFDTTWTANTIVLALERTGNRELRY